MEPLLFGTPIDSQSPEDTERLAARFFAQIAPNAIVAIYGPLGAGKTCFVRGIAAAAGIPRDEVNSPSFTLITEYPGGKTPIFHFDLYRLKNTAELYAIGGEEYFTRDGIILIEWADNGWSCLPRKRYDVRFEIIDEQTRRITFERMDV